MRLYSINIVIRKMPLKLIVFSAHDEIYVSVENDNTGEMGIFSKKGQASTNVKISCP